LHETRAQLASATSRLDALRIQAQNAVVERQPQYRPEDSGLLVGMVQEFRTPMTSIIGYVDLLLGESAGILGEMQRKFLQRVSTNISRLVAMLNDLIRITELDTGSITFNPSPINLTSVIEDAVTKAAIQFREKGLVVNLDLVTGLPSVYVDRDAIDQVVGQLLSNAYLVSPPDSEIFISVQRREMPLPPNSTGALVECVYVAVEDRGGGINPEDEARVFSRKYRAENPLVPGLGDTGVGLAIAKALVEAQGGRLWVETKERIGSRFAFVLPLKPIAEARE